MTDTFNWLRVAKTILAKHDRKRYRALQMTLPQLKLM
jgi:hypothetical protein